METFEERCDSTVTSTSTIIAFIEKLLKLTDESETQSVLDAAVEPALHAAEDAYTANATPLTELN